MGERPNSVKRILRAWGAILALTVCVCGPGAEELEGRVRRLEAENAELRALVEGLSSRLEQLEGRAPVAAATRAKSASPSMEERLEKLEERAAEQKDRGWFYSQQGQKIRLSGRVELEYRDVGREDNYYFQSTDHPEGTFALDKAVLRLDSRFTRDVDGRLRIDAYDDRAVLREAFVDWDNLPADSRLRVGLMQKFFRPGRLTETYPLVGTAFWRARDLGVDWRWRHSSLYGHLAVYNGLQLNDKEIGEDDSFPTIRDDFEGLDLSRNKELAAGLGWRRDWGEWGRSDFLVFGVGGELSSEDRDFLALAFEPLTLPGTHIRGYPDSDDDEKTRVGINARYDVLGARLEGQYIRARDGELDRDGWYAEVSYFIEREARYFRAFRPLVRYGELESDLPASPFNSLSWDRRAWTLALITTLTSDLYLRAEYNWNDETTGADSINFAAFPDRPPYTGYSRRDTIANDEFLLQLRWEF
ncbi:hypothetical protein HS125_18710 [bacterium]|nr:hypothetical protein [bacterium]